MFREYVTRQTSMKEPSGCTFAKILLPDGTTVNHTLVKEGWCWWYQKHAPDDMTLEGVEEEEAKGARKGLWADPQPVPPWE